MHFELLVEGQIERTVLEPILTKILGRYRQPHTWWIRKHQGKGELPPEPTSNPDPKNRTLLHNLPASLRAYGKSLTENQVVIVLVDLDDDDRHHLEQKLYSLLAYCNPAPATSFHFAIEELEAWFFGDKNALLAAYPNAKLDVLSKYQQDSICGTWEMLADAIYLGGVAMLKTQGKSAVQDAKREWAKNIAPKMKVEDNSSPSFQEFYRTILRSMCYANGSRELREIDNL